MSDERTFLEIVGLNGSSLEEDAIDFVMSEGSGGGPQGAPGGTLAQPPIALTIASVTSSATACVLQLVVILISG